MEQVASAVLSISIVDDQTIHTLNRDHLQHDEPTDVISFQLDFGSGTESFQESEDVDNAAGNLRNEADDDQSPGSEDHNGTELRAAGAAIEGEIIASAEMAASMAAQGGWSAHDELTLYVIHGLLHICGYDDLTAEEQSAMRTRERAILGSLGLKPVYAEDAESPCE